MNWDLTRQIDSYCERTDFTLWSEPINAITNGAFVLFGLFLFMRLSGQPRMLAALIVLIGLASLAFHTTAEVWAAAADSLIILIFVLCYLYFVNREILGVSRLKASLLALGYIPFSAALVPLFGFVPGLGSSAGYAPLPVLILIYAALVRARAPELAKGWVIGALILAVSIAFRAADEPLCDVWPVGTHFVWHMANAAMLSWMVIVFARFQARKAKGQAAAP